MADIGWITGHSYIVYGPLALGATSVVYEGTPTHPDLRRPWRIAEQLGVNIFHTSPTAVRALRRLGADVPSQCHQNFKHMTSVGEPIEPSAWRWYYEQVGKGKAVIVSGMGKSGHIARKIAATMSSTGTPAYFIHPAEASHGDLGVLTREDVL